MSEDKKTDTEVGSELGTEVGTEAATETATEDKTEKKTYICQTCGKRFDTETSVEMHALGAHGSKNAWKGEVQETPPPPEEKEKTILDTIADTLKSETSIPTDIREQIIDWLSWSDLPTWDQINTQFVQWLLSSVTGQLKNFGIGDKPILKVTAKLRNIFQKKMMEQQRIQEMLRFPTYQQPPQQSGVQPQPFFGSQQQTPQQYPIYSTPWQQQRKIPPYQEFSPSQPPPQQPPQQAPPPYYQPQPQQQSPKRKKTYKVVVDGEVIEAEDADEYRLLKQFEEERKEREEERERSRERHEKEMRRLDEEIKKIQEKEETEKPKEEERTIPFPIDEQGQVTINIPEREALIWQMMKQQSSKSKEEEEDKVPITIEGQQVKVSPTIAAMIESRRQERSDEVKSLKNIVARQQKQMGELQDQIKEAKESKKEPVTGKTTVDVVDKKLPEGNALISTAEEFFKRFPPQLQKQEEPQYKPQKTEPERKETAKEIMDRLGKTEEDIDKENDLFRTARDLTV